MLSLLAQIVYMQKIMNVEVVVIQRIPTMLGNPYCYSLTSETFSVYSQCYVL